jgi:hypothetical protein
MNDDNRIVLRLNLVMVYYHIACLVKSRWFSMLINLILILASKINHECIIISTRTPLIIERS